MSSFNNLKGTPMREAFAVDSRFCINKCVDADGWKSTPKNMRTPTDYPGGKVDEDWLAEQERSGNLKCNKVFQNRCQKDSEGEYICENPGENCAPESNVVVNAAAMAERRNYGGTAVPDTIPQEALDTIAQLKEDVKVSVQTATEMRTLAKPAVQKLQSRIGELEAVLRENGIQVPE